MPLPDQLELKPMGTAQGIFLRHYLMTCRVVSAVRAQL